MGAAAGCVNIFTALLQFTAWRKMAQHVRVSVRFVDVATLKKMFKYCAVLTVWSVCMLFVSGLDVTIVGNYSFGETAYYSIAASPTTFVLMIIAALMSPCCPQLPRLTYKYFRPDRQSAAGIHTVCHPSTLFLLTRPPLLVLGYLIRVWVGPVYALHSVHFLRILV